VHQLEVWLDTGGRGGGHCLPAFHAEPVTFPNRVLPGTRRGFCSCALWNASAPPAQRLAQGGRAVWSQPLLSTTK